jgi:hypothetical protein
MAKKPSMWVTEKYTAKNGKEYQRYALDDQGNKIPRDASNVEAIVAERAKQQHTTHKRKSIMKHHLLAELEKQYYRDLKHLQVADIRDGKSTCRVILIGKDDWLLIRVTRLGESKRYFLNVKTKEHIEFIPEQHKKGYGNNSVIWPVTVKQEEEVKV